MTARAGNIRQKDLAAALVAPAIMAHVVGRPADHIDQYIGLGDQSLDQRALAGTDFPKKAEMDAVLARGKLLELGLGVADVDAGSLGFTQTRFNIGS